MQRCIVLAVVSVLAAGCAADPYRERRPARFLLGANARDLAGASTSAVAARGETMPTRTASADTAITGSGQFTLGIRNLIVGVELEEGRLDTQRSNFAGAYGVIGAEASSPMGSIGVELVSGWRGLRLADEDDVNTFIAEPRVRGMYRLGEQVSVGGVIGATLNERGSWMAGFYLGFHSRAFGPL